MGTNQSKPVSNQQSPQIAHPIFQTAKIVTKQEQDFLQISVAVPSENQFKKWQTLLKDVPSNTQPYMIPVQFKFTKQGYCGSSGIVTILYQNFPYLLADQIMNREALNHKLFDQNQLWYLIYTALAAASGSHQMGKKLGDIRPENIFINQQGQVKIGALFSWPGQQSNYSKTFYEKTITYLAPEQIKDVHFGKMQTNTNFNEAETFSIGLTLLSAATLKNSNELYKSGLKLDYEALQRNLNQLRQAGYSQVFCILLQNMCQVDPLNRQTCTHLYEWLKPYQDSIIALQNFQIQGIPPKLSASHQKSQYNSNHNTFVQTSNIKSGYQQSQMKIVNNYSNQASPNSKVQRNQQQQKSRIEQNRNYQIESNNNVGKSQILSKIDQQLEISRKMFPG